jgi:O-antigen ligase
MTAHPVLIIIVLIFLWLLRYRFRDNFLRAYALFYLILLIYASNKEYYGIPPALSESVFSPLSMMRWGFLIIFAWYAWRIRRPASFQIDAGLSAILILLICDMMISALYAENFNYSFMRALSFALLAFAVMRGMAFYCYSSVNCVHLFRFIYYSAWIILAPMIALLLFASGYGVTIIAGKYAGFFGNQNMLGTFSALITPFVLFHLRMVARKRWDKALDLILLVMIFAGLWLSGSRNGLASGLLAVVFYFFVINLQSRLKILSAGICLVIAFAISPSLKTDITQFVRKGIDKSAPVTDLSSQIIEEKRFEMWAGVWPMFWKEKLTGYGFASSHLLVFPFTKDEEAGRALHNSYLEIFGDLGLPGLILLLLILCRVGAKAFSLLRQGGEYLERNINATFIAVFIAGSANAFLESWMFSVGNLTSLIYWGSVAGVIARRSWSPVEVREPRDFVGMQPELNYTALRTRH